jgi:aryl carrier-like protein
MDVSKDQAIADVADVLYTEPDELDLDLDLRDQGLDSVRTMELVERWRTAGVTEIDFIALAQDQRLARWIDVLEELQQDRPADA